jgi:hypothetical protein
MSLAVCWLVGLDAGVGAVEGVAATPVRDDCLARILDFIKVLATSFTTPCKALQKRAGVRPFYY